MFTEWWIGLCFEGNDRGLIDVLSNYFVEELRETTKISIEITGVSARTDHFLIKGPEHYRYANQLHISRR
jgi:predicted choloylglycine hydrolase